MDTYFWLQFVLTWQTNVDSAGGVTSFAWNSECSMLAMIREEELCVVPYPPAVPNDPSLLDKFTIRQNVRYWHRMAITSSRSQKRRQLLKKNCLFTYSSFWYNREYGKHVVIESFNGHQVTLERGDGLTFPVYLSPYPSKLQQFVCNGQWESAQRLCSSIKVSRPTAFIERLT